MVVEADRSIDQAQIHRLLDDWAQAIRDRDIDKVMSCYSDDIVSFDMIPPLQYKGADSYRQNWQMGFSYMAGPMNLETHELELTIGDEVAFCHRLNRLSGKMRDGQMFDNWVRWTACLRKINGRWLIAHEHISVPVDPKSGKGLMDLKP